jgi:ribosomal protein S27AE
MLPSSAGTARLRCSAATLAIGFRWNNQAGQQGTLSTREASLQSRSDRFERRFEPENAAAMLTFDRHCPRCGSGKIYKSRFRNLEVLLPLSLLRPVRCGKCEFRYYRPIYYAALSRFFDDTIE